MSASLNLAAVADTLVALNLVTLEPVTPERALLAAGDEASNGTFEKIARILLERSPPIWLKVAVGDGRVSAEYIPDADLDALAWLGESLYQILQDVWCSLQAQDDQTAKAIGDAAEILLFTALKRQGGRVTHVSQISDAYGYDIEYRYGNETSRLEVKACSEKTADRFILSRNEYDKSQIFCTEWRLIQVVFKVGAVFNGTIGAEDVVEIRELTPDIILSLCPPNNHSFRWLESAEFRPGSAQWTLSKIKL